MSGDADQESKTEEASDKRKQDLRKEGKVAVSHDLSSAGLLLAVGGALYGSLDELAGACQQLTVRALRLSDPAHPERLLGAVAQVLGIAFAPIAAASVAAVVAGMAQTRGLFSLELAMPKAERLDVLSHAKNLLPGKQMFGEMAKSLIKMGVLAIVVYRVVADDLPRLIALASEDVRVAGQEALLMGARISIWGVAAFAAVAALDAYYVRHKFQSDTKMTKEELKEEHKQEEQDPQVKRRMRQMAKEMMRNAKVGDLSTASVLVTNPTHFAVALRYDKDKDAAPIILAKAVEEGALNMRKRARKLGVPIVENRPLARALHKHGKVGQVIPADMYRAVAAIIVHVMRLKAGVRS